MKILHTADWHIGQLFHEYDRTYEHQQFLDWLVPILKSEQIDVLLISGDVFDLSNPAAVSVTLFYKFLSRAIATCPDLQIVITAGNHDSASRLESPKPLLESSNIHIVGMVQKHLDGSIDYDKLIVPLHNQSGEVEAWCIAVPFLRIGDYPSIADCSNPYNEGVAALYSEAYEHAKRKQQPGQAIIAMGHLHTHSAEISELDTTERLIMGGVECIPAAAFHKEIKYVALGHIHKAQRIGGNEHIRYSGSALPMSFSETNYKHQVIVFDLNDNCVVNIESIEIPLSVELLRLPTKHQPLHDVIPILEQLPNTHSNSPPPYLEVRVLLTGPEPALRHRIESATAGKHVRLAKIDVKYPAAIDSKNEFISEQKLNELQPHDVFSRIYESKYKAPVPADMLQLFNEVAQQVTKEE
jgi:exonuclease SbcD